MADPRGGSVLVGQVTQEGGGSQYQQWCTDDVTTCCGQVVRRDHNNYCRFPTCDQTCPNVQPNCVPGGANGELCVEEGSQLAFHSGVTQDSACYHPADCKRIGGACAWDVTPALQQCLLDNAGGTCPSDQSCLTRTACSAGGGSAGVSCGAGNANVCCGNVLAGGQPLEQCDDGNRVDGDACGNDCQLNCVANADCPEGACVAGQCVDQCPAVGPQAGADVPVVVAQVQNAHGAAPDGWREFFARMFTPQPSSEFTLVP
jgi:hypothetical protein